MKCDELKAFRALNIDEDETGMAYPKAAVDAAIAELKAKLESVQATAYAESVDAGMENRRLKRALWLARAERAKAIKWHEGLERYLQERKNIGHLDSLL